MPNPSDGERRVTWASKSDVDEQLRARWQRADSRTDWVPCGRQWDAVRVQPLGRGLAALDRLGLSMSAGYPVLADHLSSWLYVMVPAGTGMACARATGARVLSSGAQLLVPTSGVGMAAAHWISAPQSSLLVDADRLAGALLAVADEPDGHQRAAS